MKISGWMNTDATNLVACPRCGKQPGQDCRSPSGRRRFEPHGERTQLLVRTRPDAVAAARRPGVTTAQQVYLNAVDAEYQRIYGISWADACGDNEYLDRFRQEGMTPTEFVEWQGEKQGLIRVSDLSGWVD